MRGRPPKRVILSANDRAFLEALMRDGRTEQRVARRARILLAMSHSDTVVGTSAATRKRSTFSKIWDPLSSGRRARERGFKRDRDRRTPAESQGNYRLPRGNSTSSINFAFSSMDHKTTQGWIPRTPLPKVGNLAKHLEVARNTIWGLCDDYEKVGIAALHDAPRSGRPRVLSPPEASRN